MKRLIYDPQKSGKRMNIVCFISGSGTNYREIAARGPDHNYLVFTNRPGCAGTAIARENKHGVIELSHAPYLKTARDKYGPGKVPRNCPERVCYEQDAVGMIENKLGRQPDLVCLAGYDQWFTDWTIERYFPRILNVHPGDTTRGYDGLHWVPAAKAVIAGEQSLRSTLFIADKSEDNGPILAQSAPLDIQQTLAEADRKSASALSAGLKRIKDYLSTEKIKTYPDFKAHAPEDMQKIMSALCSTLQDVLKIQGDWKIYPFAVHDLIAPGRVKIEERNIFVDGCQMPVHGYRPDENRQ
jgi:folate-dependent phosphoribosylglycinamide formyltransferase PurN